MTPLREMALPFVILTIWVMLIAGQAVVVSLHGRFGRRKNKVG